MQHVDIQVHQVGAGAALEVGAGLTSLPGRVGPPRRCGPTQPEARQARTYLERRTGAYLVHLDVDVLHTGLFPLANFPHFAGLTLEAARACLNEFTSGEKFGGLIITEVNPGDDPDGRLIKTLVAVVAEALAAKAPTAEAPREV